MKAIGVGATGAMVAMSLTALLAINGLGCRAIHPPSLDTGKVWVVETGGIEMMPIPAGSFLMGSDDGDDDAKPMLRVTITNMYWMGRTEVTQEQWYAVMGNNPLLFKCDNFPVGGVSWFDCVEFCKKLTETERSAGRIPPGYVYRLPTEAEWEYAARGGSFSQGNTYSGSDDLREVGWYIDNSGYKWRGKPHPVGQKRANELGLHDMSGNVAEWCHDWLCLYSTYRSDHVIDPSGPDSGTNKVYRGGSWNGDAPLCRVTYRFGWNPSGMPNIGVLGFRVVLARPIRCLADRSSKNQ